MFTTAARELASASGPELARLVTECAADLDRLSDADRLELVKATARLDAWTASVRATAILAVLDSAQADIAAVSAELTAREDALAVQAGAPRTAGAASHAYDDERLLHRRVGTEVALVLATSARNADREVGLALGLRAHPQLRQALAAGLIDRTQAAVVVDGIAVLESPADQARLVTSLLGPDDTPDGDDVRPLDGGVDGWEDTDRDLVRELRRPGKAIWSLTAGRLRQIVRREAAELEPGSLVEQARRSAADRRVVFEDQPDLMAELHLRTTSADAACAYRNLDRTARALKTSGDTRTLDQLRADIAIGWLTEGAMGTFVTRPSGASRPDPAHEVASGEGRDEVAGTVCLPRSTEPLVHLTMAITTLLGLDEVPATLHGPHGPIPMPAPIARELAGQDGARWKRLLYDPATGVATDLSHTYRPSRQMREFVRARDGGRSRFPVSSATHVELDHVTEFDHDGPADGGATTPANLVSLGRREHHLKTDRGLTIGGDASGTLTVTTPSGLEYLSDPELLAAPSDSTGDRWGEPPF